MEKDDKGSTIIRMGVSGWMFLLVPAYPGCPGSKAVKRSLLLLLYVLRNAHLPLAIVIVIQLSVVYTIKLTVKSCHFTTKCKGLWSYDLMALYNMIINKVICLKRQISLWLGDIQKSYSKNKKVDVFLDTGYINSILHWLPIQLVFAFKAVNTETRLLVPFSPFHVLLLSSSSSLF